MAQSLALVLLMEQNMTDKVFGGIKVSEMIKIKKFMQRDNHA